MPYFVFTDWTDRDTVVVLIEDPGQVDHARALIAGTTTDSARIGGTVTLAPVNYNIGWSFYIAPPDVMFYDVSAEVYDTDIRGVEAGVTQEGDGFLPYNRWLSWSTSLIAELNEIGGGAAADRLAGTQAHDIIFAGAGGDIVAGGEGDDHLIGEAGSDRLDGGAGADKLSGGDGVDILTGGAGYDVLDGGAGLDTASYQSATAGVTVSLSLKHLQAQDTGGAGIDTLMRIENLTGSQFGDILRGSAGANQLSGGGGNDRLAGLGGNDRLYGGAGNDRVYGGAGTDRVYGGTGNDVLAGGLGSDLFLFDTALNASSNVDFITDFSVADDTIQLDNDIFTAAGPVGTLSAAAFRTGTAALDADDRIIYDSATGRIYYDPDGNGEKAAVLFAQVNAGIALTNADFVVGG